MASRLTGIGPQLEAALKNVQAQRKMADARLENYQNDANKDINLTLKFGQG